MSRKPLPAAVIASAIKRSAQRDIKPANEAPVPPPCPQCSEPTEWRTIGNTIVSRWCRACLEEWPADG